MVAGDNEKRFKALFAQRVPATKLRGKRRFPGDNVEISVDDSFSSNGIDYLVEVDSGNMAKLLVGQYVLLDALCPDGTEKYRLLIVHTYKTYNIVRTLENLHFIKVKLGLRLEFLVVHIESIESWEGGDVEEFLRLADT